MKMNCPQNMDGIEDSLHTPTNYGLYSRFTSHIHREHGIATPFTNNKDVLDGNAIT